MAQHAEGPRQDKPTGFLAGTRILDLTQNSVGQAAAIALGDLGAEVISVMRPGYARDRGFKRMATGRNVRTILLNLKHETGSEIFERLVTTADVIVEGFRPGVTARLGIAYSDVARLRPDIIYCSVSGYGQTGPRALESGHDLNYQAIAGALPTSSDGTPIMPTNNWADRCATLNIQTAILAALVARERGATGGIHLDVSITDSMVTLPHEAVYGLSGYHRVLSGGPPGSEAPPTSILRGLHPCYQIYECADRKHLALGCVEPWFWQRVCEYFDRREWIDHQLTDGPIRDDMFAFFREAFLGRERSSWLQSFEEIDVPASPVHLGTEVVNDPQLVHRNIFERVRLDTGEEAWQIMSPVRWGQSSRSIGRPPVSVGTDTAEVLEELGYSPQEVHTAIRNGAACGPDGSTMEQNDG